MNSFLLGARTIRRRPLPAVLTVLLLALGGLVVAAGFYVLQDLAEDPGIRRSRTADHHSVAAGLLIHANRILRRENVAVADDGNLDGLLDLADQRPIGPAGVALRACTSVDRDGLQPAVLGDTRHLHRNDGLVIPAGAELAGKGDFHRRSYGAQNVFDQGQVSEQSRSAIAFDDFLDRAAEVEVDRVKAEILDDAGGVGENLRIGSKKLCGDRMLIGLVIEVIEIA